MGPGAGGRERSGAWGGWSGACAWTWPACASSAPEELAAGHWGGIGSSPHANAVTTSGTACATSKMAKTSHAPIWWGSNGRWKPLMRLPGRGGATGPDGAHGPVRKGAARMADEPCIGLAEYKRR